MSCPMDAKSVLDLTNIPAAATPRRTMRGMPELREPSPSIIKIVDGWIKKHKASGKEFSEFEWNEENLEFENFILTRNDSTNRDLNENNLDEMVEWRLSGKDFRNLNNAICFNVDGKLETGQHRAVAGLRAGIGSRHIVKIVPVGGANQSDLGRPINTRDKWKRDGVSKNYQTIRGGMIRLLLAIKHNTLSQHVRTDAKVYKESMALNGGEYFERAIRYSPSTKNKPFHSDIALGVAHYLVAWREGGEEFMEEVLKGTQRRRHMRNINSLRAFLKRLDTNSKAGDRNFRQGDALNLMALNAIILSWNSFPNNPETYIWQDEESLVPDVR